MLFRNMVRKYLKPENPAAPGPAPAAPAAPAPAAPAAPATPPPAAPAAPGGDFAAFQQWQQFQQWQSQQGQPPAPPAPAAPAPSAFDKIKADEQEKQSRQNAENELRAQVKFEIQFDDTITKNAAMFGLDALKMREGAKGLTGSELVAQLRVTAAKAFFDKEANHAIMLPDDLAYAKASIIGQADRAIDAEKAWNIVERAIQIAAIREHSDNIKGANKPLGNMPNLAAWVQRAKDKWTRK